MKVKRSMSALAGAASLALLALGAGSAARAGDVCWPVGVSSHGVQVGVYGPQLVVGRQPVYVQPQVVYTQPQVVYAQPQVIYTQPQVVYTQPRPAYVQPQPVVDYNGWHHPWHGWQHGGAFYPQQFAQPNGHAYPVQYQVAAPVSVPGYGLQGSDRR